MERERPALGPPSDVGPVSGRGFTASGPLPCPAPMDATPIASKSPTYFRFRLRFSRAQDHARDPPR